MVIKESELRFAVLAVDVVILTLEDERLKVLLTKARVSQFKNWWALPGGLVGPDESLDEAAKRYFKMLIKKGGEVVCQIAAFGEVDRDPRGRVVSVAYLALLPPGKVKIAKSKKFFESNFFAVAKAPRLAYDHNLILAKALETLKDRLVYTSIVSRLISNEFTLTDLQKAYEEILGNKLDKRNFRKKIKTLGVVKKLAKMREGEPYRPAQLFEFKTKKVIAVTEP